LRAGENAEAYALQTGGAGWQTRWLEVDNQGVLRISDDAEYRHVLAEFQITSEHTIRELEPEHAPDNREHCFTIENIGVEIALDARGGASCAAWAEKIALHRQRSNSQG
jgi:hypothetical protein